MRIESGVLSLYGLFLMVGLMVTRGVYRGQQLAHFMAQRDSGVNDLSIKHCLEGFLSVPFLRYQDFLTTKDCDSIPPMVREMYSTSDLWGYAKEKFDKGGKSLQEQQRGLIITPLCEAIRRLPDGSTVIEVGTGNGDVAAYIASGHPNLEVIGVDFNVSVAERKHSTPHSARWVTGYALHLFEAGELRADLVWASSTFALMPPMELRRLITAMREAGTTFIVLNEPSWGRLSLHDVPAARSIHLETIWHHDYPALFRELGFNVVHQTFNPYQHPLSPRPDIRLAIGVYERQ